MSRPDQPHRANGTRRCAPNLQLIGIPSHEADRVAGCAQLTRLAEASPSHYNRCAFGVDGSSWLSDAAAGHMTAGSDG